MDDEILINKIRQNDELYNIANRKYSDNHHKDIIWAKIGKELNTTGQICKTRWTSLRDQLRKTLKKKKSKSEQAAKKQKKWKYEDCMSFIIPFFKERDTHSTMAVLNSASEESNDEEIFHQKNRVTENDALDEDVKIEQEITPKRNKIMRSLSKKTKSPKLMPASYSFKTKKISKLETASSDLLKHISDNNDEPKTISYVHPVDIFFKGLAATVKTFSPEYQHEAKNKLFAIVSNLEWAQLQNETVNNQIPVSKDSATSY